MYYEWCLKAWLKGWADEAKLKIWVDAGKITQQEYDQIVNTSKTTAMPLQQASCTK